MAALLRMRWYQNPAIQERKNTPMRSSIFGMRSTLLDSKETRASTVSVQEIPFEEQQTPVEAN